MRLENKVAIITGSGNGIGMVTALRLGVEGARVVATDISLEAAERTAQSIRAHGGQALALKHDVRNETDWQYVADKAVGAFGRIDVLFNNAGILIIRPLAQTTLEEWNQTLAVNVTGVFLGMKQVVPRMAAQGSGSVINASSVAGLVGAPAHTMYGASKGAVRAMTKGVAVEYAPQGVRVNSIHPGLVDTGMADYAAKTLQREKADLGHAVSPMGRLGTAREVSELVLFLASDESSYVTGAELVVDGGMTAR
ncbi:3-alpha-hydroxysteroid dehydrogenase [Cupriavidus sp. TKC]|uniref:SDR family NAD(P)-dependent oxidoreductase n=1 Tax=Cupriavidus sp. TKC TaxID=2880159 RepID=UPI0025A8A7D9|nr:glucose 1-dehydrogenase [Cupriavidus sp. TKC]GMG90531.1 3-alpha-hydroxysteroid dehydrogenase [Cupriavidus sp. TKC]